MNALRVRAARPAEAEILAEMANDINDLETDDAAATAAALKRNGVRLVREGHDTPWNTREFVIKDNEGHTLYFGEHR